MAFSSHDHRIIHVYIWLLCGPKTMIQLSNSSLRSPFGSYIPLYMYSINVKIPYKIVQMYTSVCDQKTKISLSKHYTFDIHKNVIIIVFKQYSSSTKPICSQYYLYELRMYNDAVNAPVYTWGTLFIRNRFLITNFRHVMLHTFGSRTSVKFLPVQHCNNCINNDFHYIWILRIRTSFLIHHRSVQIIGNFGIFYIAQFVVSLRVIYTPTTWCARTAHFLCYRNLFSRLV